MNQPHLYKNTTPLNLTNEEKVQAERIITDIVQNLVCFNDLLKDKPTMEITHTHMSLFESYFKDLIPIVKYDSVMTEELNHRYNEIREKNKQIGELEKKLGQTITPEGITAKLKEYGNIIRCFYGALGFEYAALETYTQYGLIYNFRHTLQYQADDGTSGETELAKTFQKIYKPITEQPNEWDFHKDTYHAELLDTDKNRNNILNLMKETFPNSYLSEFHSKQNDYDSYSLDFKVRIDYTDIEKLKERIKLKEYDNIIRCFYGALGLQCATPKAYTEHGIKYHFSRTLYYQASDSASDDSELAKQFQAIYKPIAKQPDKWDFLHRNEYYAELLDTNGNRHNIWKLMKKTFPDCSLLKFHSKQNDCDSYSLSFEIHIDYADIEQLKEQIISYERSK